MTTYILHRNTEGLLLIAIKAKIASAWIKVQSGKGFVPDFWWSQSKEIVQEIWLWSGAFLTWTIQVTRRRKCFYCGTEGRSIDGRSSSGDKRGSSRGWGRIWTSGRRTPIRIIGTNRSIVSGFRWSLTRSFPFSLLLERSDTSVSSELVHCAGRRWVNRKEVDMEWGVFVACRLRQNEWGAAFTSCLLLLVFHRKKHLCWPTIGHYDFFDGIKIYHFYTKT